MNKKTITCGPIKCNPATGTKEGYQYDVRTETMDSTESITWTIYIDGTYEEWGAVHYPDDCPEHWVDVGTFDKSKYNDFVEQMQYFQTDWTDALCPNRDKCWYINA